VSFLGPYRDRIGACNQALNAFVDLSDFSEEVGLCYGVKSNIAVQGLPWTAGIAAYRDRIAKQDATVVSRIRRHGGTILGTVNMHEGALGATTDNEAYGRTGNPWRFGHTPGGSSGGSGSAVAAGLCDVALGSDTMGSVRIPAAYCGVQGHKPTTGIVPNDGVVALSHTLDHVGPLARSVDMLWQSMHVLADWGIMSSLEPSSLSGVRLGVWTGNGSVEMTSAVAAGFKNALRSLEGAGVTLIENVEPPAYSYGRSRRAGLLISEVEAMRVHGDMIKAHPDGFSAVFKKLLAWGAARSADEIEAAYQHVREVHAGAASLFSDVDFVISPTAPQQAFRFDEPAPANQADFTAWADFAALPATALYTGLSVENGLPLSLQIMGAEGRDRDTLQLAAAMEELFGSPSVPPGFE
jgi:aspartyl-tRNA(Asn)/glutamyl-tRNA(Gln) amidotransferase subunit A